MYPAAGTRKLSWLWQSRAYPDACLPTSHSVKTSVFNSMALKPSSERFWGLAQKDYVIFDTRPSAFTQPRVAAPCSLFFSHVPHQTWKSLWESLFLKQHYSNLFERTCVPSVVTAWRGYEQTLNLRVFEEILCFSIQSQIEIFIDSRLALELQYSVGQYVKRCMLC